ncbi:Mpo1-like protein [Synechocystis salina]|uniref:DUF962 domain-containing protein n=1 Tax=Synechocystis salina LEGE 00031 TaxID=1828736 RepID=A0ABR9VVS0_9SYNC|nr:Mpo1-like protein [Synechocystis salina]MBE9242362.1 DUF962 domain-containing protein [Synechocystis salina LEGE 00041]MBE9255444.1 DUF962 domain-containing protein [Synechocystis salina LEGE 00031]
MPSPSQRNKINTHILDHPFTDYWDIFVLKHQNPLNIALHLVGIVIFYGLLLSAWQLHQPLLLFALPLSQLTGLLGHFFFEKSHIDLQDAIFSWRASFCLGRLFWQVLTGKYIHTIESHLEELSKIYPIQNNTLRLNAQSPPSEEIVKFTILSHPMDVK